MASGEEKTLEHVSLRWLSKALNAYGPKGCFGDVVNLVFAALCRDPKEKVSESTTVATLEEFGDRLSEGDVEGLWVPTHLVHDAESDDIMALCVLEHLHRLKRRSSGESALSILCQLPTNQSLDILAVRFMAWSHCKVYRDPDAANTEAIRGHFGL